MWILGICQLADAWCFSLFCLSFLSYLLHLLQKICEAFLLWICQNEMGRQTLLSTWTYEWYINQHNYFRVLYLQSYTAPYIVTSFSKRTRLKKEKSKQLYHILVSMLLISGQLVRLCGVFLIYSRQNLILIYCDRCANKMLDIPLKLIEKWISR